MELLTGFLNAHEAHIFRTRLEADGIGAFMQGEDFVYMNWAYAMAIGGVRIYVVEEELPRARETIAKCLDGTYRRELAAEFGDLDDLKCPNCGSENFRSRSSYFDIALVVALYLLTRALIRARARVHFCDTCHTRWADDQLG